MYDLEHLRQIAAAMGVEVIESAPSAHDMTQLETAPFPYNASADPKEKKLWLYGDFSQEQPGTKFISGLHELGHIATSPPGGPNAVMTRDERDVWRWLGIIPESVKRVEIEAWRWAFQHLGVDVALTARGNMREALATYQVEEERLRVLDTELLIAAAVSPTSR